MKNLDIVIATRDRYEKLKRALNSIPKKSFIKINIIIDKGCNGAVYCRNLVIPKCEDGVLYATDDMTFEPNAIENALSAFNRKFPDDDGVVGFVQIPDNFHPTGVALVGQKFLQRYPDKQLFNPEYFHFACQEIYWLASRLGKFHQEPTAIIRHYHPAFFKEEMDKTHQEARIHREKDHALMRERQAKGLIWGLN